MSDQQVVRPPYVGTQSLTEYDPIFGRDWERTQLRDLLLAKRIVLMHSPSGAGKTSLVQAGLIPLFRDCGIQPLGPVRPGVDQRSLSEALLETQNRYVFNVIMQLEERRPAEGRLDPSRVAVMQLEEYLDHLAAVDGGPPLFQRLLVLDQFEEVLTLDPTDLTVKRKFFRLLGQTLREIDVYAVICIRDDYVGALEPYLDYLPKRLSTRFRLDLLNRNKALEAIERPAACAGVVFEGEASQLVCDSLSEIRVLDRTEGVVTKQGNYVEAVQLQVVCSELYDTFGLKNRRITKGDVESLGPIDNALGRFYASKVNAAAIHASFSESALRNWIEERLITPQNLREQVMDGSPALQEIRLQCIEDLVNAYVLREEPRRNARWFELAHDRLVNPIKADNARWREQNTTPLAQQARQWQAAGKPFDLLLSAAALTTAVPDTRAEREFVAESHKYAVQKEKDSRAEERKRNLAMTGWGVIFAENARPEFSTLR